MKDIDVLIIGAGAAGLMCAIEAGKRGRRVVVLDSANKPGKKILMSGGGRCNFTNHDITPDNYISHNPHFCKSALSRYTQWDFVKLVQQHGIAFHEKKAGQLFCDESSKDILNMLLNECDNVSVNIHLKIQDVKIKQIADKQFQVTSSNGNYRCESLVIATGGLSIPTMGSSNYGYKVAAQFGIKVWPTCAGLVPYTLHDKDKQRFAVLSGISVDSVVSCGKQNFRENILFTHRGLSGPAILNISSYWKSGHAVFIDLLPDTELLAVLKQAQRENPQLLLKNFLGRYLPKRVTSTFIIEHFSEQPLQSITHKNFEEIALEFKHWQIRPNATEGYRTAEVTLGGVDCNAVSSKTMMSNKHASLYFIGEVLDITGWLGGYNFQWAWSSAWAAGQVV